MSEPEVPEQVQMVVGLHEKDTVCPRLDVALTDAETVAMRVEGADSPVMLCEPGCTLMVRDTEALFHKSVTAAAEAVTVHVPVRVKET